MGKKNSVFLLFSGRAPKKQGDEAYPFSPNRNFFYTTGIARENMLLLLGKTQKEAEEILYIPRDHGALSRWVGTNMTVAEAASTAGLEAIRYTDEFLKNFTEYIQKNQVKHLYLEVCDGNPEEACSIEIRFANWVRHYFPTLILQDCGPIFRKLREKKTPDELEKIKQAIQITIQGMEAMMRHAKPGMMEYEIEAYFDFVLKQRGVKEKAFPSIAASGKNGCILHYTENNQRTEDNELILFDVGAQVGYYNGDLTRTFPVNGKFTERQRKFYEIVLEGQKKVIDSIRPGVPFEQLNQTLLEYYFTVLSSMGLIKTKEEVGKYYWHSVSHHLGALTHDVGRRGKKKLEAGMVITVEPGLYLEEYGIGIRIEDDVLVTEDGCEVLSKQLVKTVEEIEAFMRG